MNFSASSRLPFAPACQACAERIWISTCSAQYGWPAFSIEVRSAFSFSMSAVAAAGSPLRAAPTARA